MSVQINDGCANGEIIEHKKIESKNKCSKCGLCDMKPLYQPIGLSCKYNRLIEGIKKFMRHDTYYNSDEVKTEHIIWTCPECNYSIAKSI